MKKRVSCLLLGLLLTSTALAQVAAAQETTPESTEVEVTAEATPVFARYTVVEGDTLGNIAFRYHTTSMAILRANNLSDPDLIYFGTVLLIPVGQTSVPAATAAPTATAVPTQIPTLVPIPSIGFELGGEIVALAHLDTLSSTGMTWARLRQHWGAGDTTASIERIITRLHEAGLKVLLEIDGAAPNANPNLALYYANFASYLGEVAALAPDAIEVWSGMNVEQEWAHGLNDADTYSDLLRTAYTAIKRANPGVLVISGALAAGEDNAGYLDGLAGAGAGQYADCIGMGYTQGALPPDATEGDARGDEFSYYFPLVIATYAHYFPDKPLCLTEVGYLVVGNLPLATRYDWAENTTPELRAEWLAQAATIARNLGRVRLFMVYNVDAAVGSPDDPQANYAILSAEGACLACAMLLPLSSVG
ncbi:MAG: LysM peptidoglycan-binding domain-containing protein [Chloroflexota bacterium]